MFRQRKFQLRLAWTLLFAVLFNIAAPSLAMSRKSADFSVLHEICSTNGPGAIVGVVGERSPGNHADLLHDGHCQLCTIKLVAGPFPVSAGVLPIAIEPSPVPLPGQIPGSAPSPDCPPPPSRAPPFFS